MFILLDVVDVCLWERSVYQYRTEESEAAQFKYTEHKKHKPNKPNTSESNDSSKQPPSDCRHRHQPSQRQQ